MFDWKILAVATPLLFVIYQTISKILPKNSSIFLVNAYAALVGFIIMLVLHFFLSPNKSLTSDSKTIVLALIIGVLISLGNFGIIKAYSQGAPQSLFTPIFYVALIIYGILFGWIIWHERTNPMQIFGIVVAVVGLLMTVYFKK